MFDNDGTLWCKKPMPIQLDFIVTAGAEDALVHDFVVVSMKRDWTTVFA